MRDTLKGNLKAEQSLSTRTKGKIRDTLRRRNLKASLIQTEMKSHITMKPYEDQCLFRQRLHILR